MIPPTCEQISEEDGVEVVDRQTDDSWRHGVRVKEVFHRPSDHSFWRVEYRLSTDGETNELADGTADISQVWPAQKLVTVYISLPPATPTSDNQGVPVAESDAHAREPECGMRPVSVWHGKTCQRQEHTKGGYGHDFDDDSPYDVDGVSYCGRCHHCLDESERVDIVGPEQQADIIASQRERAEEDAQNRHRSPL